MLHPDCFGCAGPMLEGDVAARLGISRRHARRLIAQGELVRLRRSVVAGACQINAAAGDPAAAHRLRVAAWLTIRPTLVPSHQSAAVLADLPLLTVPEFAIFTRETGGWRSAADVKIRIAPLPAHHLQHSVAGTMTTPPRTFVDIARRGAFREAVVVGDAVVRDHCDPATLAATVDDCADWSDVTAVRRAAAFLDGRSESALESLSRVIIYERRLPPPEPQRVIHLARTSYRVDFYWAEQRTIGEADGLQKYTNSGVLRAEKIRQEALERAGYKVVRWTWRDIVVDTEETIDRIRAKLAS